MASKEVEVLDPAPTVEKLKKSASERVLNRRHFIAALGVAGAAVAGTELVRSGPTALAQQPKPNGYAQVDVLNFLLNIKYLKATLYSFLTQGTDLVPTTNNSVPVLNLGSGGVFNPPAKIATWAAGGPASAQEIQDLFGAMYYDELSDLGNLRTLIAQLVGSANVPSRATVNLLGTGVTTATGTTTVTQVQAISLLRMLEDLSAAAFAGATIYLTGTYLQYATQSLAVNGFHAGALRLVAMESGAPYYSPQDLTTSSAGTQTQNSFTANLISGSTTIYNFAPTNPITVGAILTGPGVLPNTTVTAVNPTPVYTGSLTGSTTSPNLTISNVAPTTGLAVNMAIAGTGIPTNSVITNISGSTITIGAITGYSSLTPPTPVFNGLTSVTGTPGQLMTLGTYPLVFSSVGATVPAQGSLTVTQAGTTTQPGSYTIALTQNGQGYTTAPTVTVPTLSVAAGTIAAGGTAPVLTANIPAQITTSLSTVTLTPGYIAATTKGSNILNLMPLTAGLAPGQILSGTGLPSNSFIAQGGISASAGTLTLQQGAANPLAVANASATTAATPTGVVTKTSAVITQVSSVAGILPGMQITGTGIPTSPATTVLYSDPVGLTITMSAAATIATSGTSTTAPTCLLTKGSNLVTCLSSVTAPAVAAGNAVSGTNVPTGTTITSVGLVNTMTLSQAASGTTATTVGATGVTAIIQSGNNILSYVYPTTALASGQLIIDTQGNIPAGTTVTGVTAASNTITLSAPATGATIVSPALFNFTGTVVVSYETISAIPAAAFTATPTGSSTPYLSVGAAIVGPNIPSGTIINGVSSSAGTITISQFPTAALGAELIAATLSILPTTTINTWKLQTVTITAPTTATALTIPTLETITPSLATATLSQAPTASGITTVIVEGTDNQDVEPNDPGTITFAGIVTSGSAAVTGVTSLAGLAVGLLVAGTGIPAGATIATITSATSTITLSAAATAGATTPTTLIAYLTNAAALAAAGPQLLSEPAWSSTTAYPVGAAVQYSGSNYVALAANTDVNPASNPGTWQSTPAYYGGFFDTAGGPTSSANNPAGSTFARTFSQVLAVLYGSTTPQTYEGGFFPFGVSGPINTV